ncbi:MAG: bifunctional phosphopantothenoylcysteine decarboxylase/phosphopantothenate--cysteine ligase CoaBC [Bacteroidales bacterium]|nr:bifunctional phosphopantothenoylcysteine decarboxylase/phosphopantothenate--cysteine ligase CoaBC [Bacteroidales bacterium]
MLKGKKILIGVTASIAAYKAIYLVRLFIKEGAEVQVVMTPNAKDFVTPLTLSALSNRPVLIEPFNPDDGEWNSHVDLGNWADIMIVAPASANTLAKMANGIADNLLLATFLAAKCPVFFAPAMDLDMYKHPATQNNVKKLIADGFNLIDSSAGELASGLVGQGRLQEPEIILQIIKEFFAKKNDLKGKNILITAGPTYENIDPVRFIGNYSSGLMGFSIAKEAVSRGGNVTLVSGPVNLNIDSVNRIDVVNADQMYNACLENYSKADIIIMAAAVADYTPINCENSKIKKYKSKLSIDLKPTVDILSKLGELKSDKQILVGFALETDNEIENAKSKLKKKNLDFIVLNSLKDKGAGFKYDTNKISIIDINDNIQNFELKSKKDVAVDIIDKLVEYINSH